MILGVELEPLFTHLTVEVNRQRWDPQYRPRGYNEGPKKEEKSSSAEASASAELSADLELVSASPVVSASAQ